jgi:hypothetical protein
MEYYTADTYKGWRRLGDPFSREGKLYTKVEEKCDRCTNGVFVCRIENGQPIPHPNAGGVCFKCGGTGIIRKEVRLYTKSQYDSMKRAQVQAKERKAAAQEEKMKKEFTANKAKWLKDNGFNEDGITYIHIGDTYSIKDSLKEAGFIFNPILLWHKADPKNFEDKVIAVSTSSIIEFSAWGKGMFLSSAADYVKEMLDKAENKKPSKSEWQGDINQTFSTPLVILKSINTYSGQYNLTYIYNFEDKEENKYSWWSTKIIPQKIGDELYLTGKVKSHDEFKNQKITRLTRCKITTESNAAE